MKTLRIEGQLIFPGGKRGKPLSDAAMAAVIDRMNEENEKAGRPKWTDPRLRRPVVPHGFRSTFKDWASECTSFLNIVSEMALAHKVSDKVEAAYRQRRTIANARSGDASGVDHHHDPAHRLLRQQDPLVRLKLKRLPHASGPLNEPGGRVGDRNPEYRDADKRRIGGRDQQRTGLAGDGVSGG